MRGRAALVWTDTADTTCRGRGRVWLARAGLSPLAIAHDVDGGLWWASNPEWLRRLSVTFDLPLRKIELMPEGVLMSATPQQRRIKMTVHARFKPTVRHQDLRLVRAAVWRNFTPADRRDDGAIMRHRVVGAGLRLSAQPGVSEMTILRIDCDTSWSTLGWDPAQPPCSSGGWSTPSRSR